MDNDTKSKVEATVGLLNDILKNGTDRFQVWQPIETAGQESEPIIILMRLVEQKIEWVGIGYWYWESYDQYPFEKNGWFVNAIGLKGLLGDDNQPTHWMPCPPCELL